MSEREKETEQEVDDVMLICVDCGNEQPDMGRGVLCESCGGSDLEEIFWVDQEEPADG